MQVFKLLLRPKLSLLFICLLVLNIASPTVFASWFNFHKKTTTPEIKSEYTFTQQFTGIDGDALENVQDAFNNAIKINQPITPAKIKTIYKNSEAIIKKALEPYGYFKSKFTSKLIYKDKHWHAIYNIIPGPQLTIENISLQVTGPGKNNPNIKKFIKKFPLKVGQPLLMEKYNNSKTALYNMAQEQGYLNAKLTKHIVQINLQSYSANIILVFNTGPRYYFGPISFSKNPYADKFLERFVPFHYGDPYSSKKILKLENNLGGSIYFHHVAVHPEHHKTKNHHVPLHVVLIPRKTQQYSFGVGFGTDTGLRGSVGWTWRHVTDTGNYFQAVVQASEIQNNFQARYVIPGENPVTDHYEINAGVVRNRTPVGDYQTYFVGGNYVSDIGYGWQRTLFISAQRERFNVFTSNIVETQFIIPGISFQKIKANNRINTDNGYRINFKLLAGQAINTNNQFIQAQLHGKYIKSLTKNSRILLRGDLGATLTSRLTKLPLSLRFFAGGTQSVRGFGFQGLGPGKYLIVGSTEYQHRIYKHLWGGIFYDVGNAFDNTPIKLKSAAGIGLIYRSPLGAIELTLAKPLDKTQSFKQGLRVQFVMGPDL